MCLPLHAVLICSVFSLHARSPVAAVDDRKVAVIPCDSRVVTFPEFKMATKYVLESNMRSYITCVYMRVCMLVYVFVGECFAN